MKTKFKILDIGNFYFPIMDKGKNFIVEDTLEIDIEKINTKILDSDFKHKTLDFSLLAKPIWETCKKELKGYKNHWFVPIRLYKLGNQYVCTVDVLKKVR